jgi:hypothetical protein
LHTSTSGWIHGSEPSFRNRRSNASEAHRYWVGVRPIWLNARRHAVISGNSLSGRWASRAVARSRNGPVVSATSGAAVTPVTDKVATHSWGELVEQLR